MITDLTKSKLLHRRAKQALSNIKYLNESTSNQFIKNNNPSELNTGNVLGSPIKMNTNPEVFKVDKNNNLEETLLKTPLNNECVLYPASAPEKTVLENIGLDVLDNAKTFIIKDKNDNIKAALSINESFGSKSIKYMDVSDNEEYLQEAIITLGLKPSGYELTFSEVSIEECVIPMDNIGIADDDSAFIKIKTQDKE